MGGERGSKSDEEGRESGRERRSLCKLLHLMVDVYSMRAGNSKIS